MKNRRDFLKLIGIGAGAAASVALAAVAARTGGSTPPAPRSIVDVERGPKTYEGPDGMPGGDFIRKTPDFIREMEDFEYVPEVNRIGPYVNVPPDDLLDKMVDNVFEQSPLHQYLTTTGTHTIPISEGNNSLTCDAVDLEDMTVTIDPAADFYNWSTVWNDMAPDAWGRNE